ncbi:MAG: DNA adenine methylase [Methylobacter sp.]
MINSPFKWVGGKSRLRKFIIPLFPSHTCYVEPFAGAGWVLFGKEPSAVEVLNDIDQEVINFFRVVKSNPEALIDAFEFELVSRAEFDRLAMLDTSQLNEIQRAHRFYYIIMAGWGGELKHPRIQTSISDGGHGNRLIGAIKTLQARLRPVHARLSTVLIENLDWQKCVDRYDREGTLMYLDPPYPDNKCNYFHNMRNAGDHELLANRLQKTKCKWILSSYDKEDVRSLYPDSFIIPISSMSGMKSKKGQPERLLNQEILIMNFVPDLFEQTSKTEPCIKNNADLFHEMA